VYVPASEVIHDIGHPFFHPLVGVSPIYACGASAVQGLRIQNNSSRFFANGSKPGGVLTTKGQISSETATRIKTYWDENFVGDNMGKVAVLGDGLKYEAMTVTAEDSQLIEQLKWTDENICTAFHVPAYKVGVGTPPSYNNVEALDTQYYAQCLQFHLESLELVMDEGLGLAPDKVDGRRLGVEFDLDDLMRMDTSTQIKTLAEAVRGGLETPNEARLKRNRKPLVGGDTVYLQEQDHSLEALAKRDAKPDPFAKTPATQPALNPAPTPEDETQKYISAFVEKMAEVDHAAA